MRLSRVTPPRRSRTPAHRALAGGATRAAAAMTAIAMAVIGSATLAPAAAASPTPLDARKAGTTPLTDVLGADGNRYDRNGGDFDIQMLERRPELFEPPAVPPDAEAIAVMVALAEDATRASASPAAHVGVRQGASRWTDAARRDGLR